MPELHSKINELDNYIAHLGIPIKLACIVTNKIDGWSIFENRELEDTLYVGLLFYRTPTIDIYHAIEYPTNIPYEALQTTPNKIQTWIDKEFYSYYIIHHKNPKTYYIYTEINEETDE